jgi:hypothetical protein
MASASVRSSITSCYFSIGSWLVVSVELSLPKVERAMSPSIIDPYLPLIVETLKQYPRLTAARLYAMALERGYTGGASHFRARVSQLRPRPTPDHSPSILFPVLAL